MIKSAVIARTKDDLGSVLGPRIHGGVREGWME